MAYNNRNYLKRCKRIIEIYNKYKNPDIPDTRIVKHIFPKYDIDISYRQWMNIKGKPIPKN